MISFLFERIAALYPTRFRIFLVCFHRQDKVLPFTRIGETNGDRDKAGAQPRLES